MRIEDKDTSNWKVQNEVAINLFLFIISLSNYDKSLKIRTYLSGKFISSVIILITSKLLTIGKQGFLGAGDSSTFSSSNSESMPSLSLVFSLSLPEPISRIPLGVLTGRIQTRSTPLISVTDSFTTDTAFVESSTEITYHFQNEL